MDDPIARLQLKPDEGERTLNFDPEHGYPISMLKELEISTTPQVFELGLQQDQFPAHADLAQDASVGLLP